MGIKRKHDQKRRQCINQPRYQDELVYREGKKEEQYKTEGKKKYYPAIEKNYYHKSEWQEFEQYHDCKEKKIEEKVEEEEERQKRCLQKDIYKKKDWTQKPPRISEQNHENQQIGPKQEIQEGKIL